MKLNLEIYFLNIFMISEILCQSYTSENDTKIYKDELGEHNVVSKSNVFPYVVGILKKFTYLSAGALVTDQWVLTAADSLFLMRESLRMLRVRLGSINHRKGGILLPVKFFEVHPLFNDTKPEYDIALLKLSQPVRLTDSLNPIRMQRRVRGVTATHFIVTSWPFPTVPEGDSDELQNLQSMEIIKRRRILRVSHLHPTDPDRCVAEMRVLDINATDTIMCLDPSPETDGCTRDVGAPVVINNILWGIVSSFKQEDCVLDPGLTFVTLVAARDIRSWIHATVSELSWRKERYNITEEVDEDYEDENVDANFV